MASPKLSLFFFESRDRVVMWREQLAWGSGDPFQALTGLVQIVFRMYDRVLAKI